MHVRAYPGTVGLSPVTFAVPLSSGGLPATFPGLRSTHRARPSCRIEVWLEVWPGSLPGAIEVAAVVVFFMALAPFSFHAALLDLIAA